jgi:hypothetical protein
MEGNHFVKHFHLHSAKSQSLINIEVPEHLILRVIIRKRLSPEEGSLMVKGILQSEPKSARRLKFIVPID